MGWCFRDPSLQSALVRRPSQWVVGSRLPVAIGGLRRRNAVPIFGRPVQHHLHPSRSSARFRMSFATSNNLITLHSSRFTIPSFLISHYPSLITHLSLLISHYPSLITHLSFLHIYISTRLNRHPSRSSARFRGAAQRGEGLKRACWSAERDEEVASGTCTTRMTRRTFDFQEGMCLGASRREFASD